MSWRKANSPGWASFDLKQRQQKDGSLFVDCLKEEEKPSLPPIPHKKKNHLIPPVRSFSSVLLPPPAMEFPTLADENNNNNNNNNNNIRHIRRPSSGSTAENDTLHACTKLKELYGWADESLITDVLAAVDKDISKASALLAGMVCVDSSEQKKDISIQESKSDLSSLELKCSGRNEGSSSRESADMGKSNRDGSLNYANGELSYEYASCRDEGSGKATAQKNPSLDYWKNVPAEPEWEEDDIYFIHRRKAVHMMRSASQHSKRAADAYIRGDHFSAQQFSAKAREEWTASERLNAIAAKEILSIRNNGNDPWKLDLHGLHALEAIQALQEHLQKLEHLVPSDRSLSPDRRNGNKPAGDGIGRSSSVESLTCAKTGGTVNLDSKYCESSSPQQRRGTSLHVITGVGNHSRGEAALPSAVKHFLNENGYRYDDARPGLITVRPKFRGRRAHDKTAS